MASININQPIILASSSPRRRELLQQLGLTFSCISPQIDETPYHQENVQDYVQRLAYTKAHEVLKYHADALIVAGDTTVSINGEILGQAQTLEQAIDIWTKLSGRWHDVFTGICICTQEKFIQQTIHTRVHFQHLNQQDMQNYWATSEPLGKAGAYAIQGIAGKFVIEIQGSYSNVVGLPLHETNLILQQFKDKIDR